MRRAAFQFSPMRQGNKKARGEEENVSRLHRFDRGLSRSNPRGQAIASGSLACGAHTGGRPPAVRPGQRATETLQVVRGDSLSVGLVPGLHPKSGILVYGG